MKFDNSASNMVKGVAIILMLMHHLFGCATMFCEQYGVKTVFIEYNRLYSFSVNAKLCVSMFVFITAFGITRQYNKKAQSHGRKILKKAEVEIFSISRYIKLLFNFVLVYLIAFATSFLRDGGVNKVYCENGLKKGVMYAVIDALGLSNYFGTPSLNETWWYMSIAILIVFITPIFIWLYKSNGIALVAVAALIYYLGINKSSFVIYVFSIALGIFCAEANLLERLKGWKFWSNKWVNALLKILVCIFLIIFIFRARGKTGYSFWIDPVLTFLICYLCLELKSSKLSGLGKVMGYLGKHSMNMFLIHTLIFEYYFTEFIYGFKNCWLILLALTLTSLLGSICIEWVKKLIHYNRMIEWFAQGICKKICFEKEED